MDTVKTRWTPEKKAAAAELWSQGVVCSEMAKKFGVAVNTIEKLAQNNRDMFPRRCNYRPPEERPQPRKPPRSGPDRVTRTVFGSKITLPRVTFIDGPYRDTAA